MVTFLLTSLAINAVDCPYPPCGTLGAMSVCHSTKSLAPLVGVGKARFPSRSDILRPGILFLLHDGQPAAYNGADVELWL